MHFIILGLIMLLSACVFNTTNYYTSTIHSWRGASAAALVRNWGRPDQQVVRSKGHIAYVYNIQGNSSYNQPVAPSIGINVNATGRPTIAGPNTNMTWNRGNISHACWVIFDVGLNGRITQVDTYGSNCFIGEKTAKKMQYVPIASSGEKGIK